LEHELNNLTWNGVVVVPQEHARFTNILFHYG
jgi:hypothetical protein